ncbi:glycoside hydrolase family 24 protein [Escherichia coli]|uniref:glycoside hydrolase family 24 protein n=1 Tax=Escherichia coli TaxID=562 RepID=UPI001C406C48|nr:glycoside hydrolase family 104 protein [Escherichia coli]
MNRNVKAFLDALAWAEGTSTSRYTKNDGYDIIVDGIDSPHTFTDYSTHPNVLVTVNRRGLKSTAAGRYQLLSRNWSYYRDLLKLPDYSPSSQDAVAVQLIKERGALSDVQAGRVETAVQKCKKIWASLPGAGYGQREVTMEQFVAQFRRGGGVIT